VHIAAAVPPPVGGGVAGLGRVAATDGEGPRVDAIRVGLATTTEGLAVTVEIVGAAWVDVGAAGDPHAPTARPAMRRRIVGRGTPRIPARARVTG